MEQKFFICKHCGNIVAYVKGIGVMCCGEEMEQLIPNSYEASKEKHIPVVEIEGNKVTVSCPNHPMEDVHHIEWISLQTKMGNQRKMITGKEPKAVFLITDDDIVECAYAFCNLHYLWRS